MKAVTTILMLLALTLSSFGSVGAAYDEVSCSTQGVFSENSCDQCFDGGTVWIGQNIGLLTDDWINDSGVKKIMYKEEQEMPQMMNLGGSSWSQTPSSDDFWEYTTELNALYSETEDGYVLDNGDSAVWLKSKLGYAYTLDSTSAAGGENVGLLVYTLATHDILEDGDITVDSDEHRECVAFTSGAAAPAPTTIDKTPTETVTVPGKVVTVPKELPETGAEHIILLLAALILGFGFFFLKQKAVEK